MAKKKILTETSTNTIYVEFIKKRIRNGDKSAVVFKEFGQKWPQVTYRTYRRRWDVAVADIQKEIKIAQERAQEGIHEEVKAIAKNIISSSERMLFLTEIVNAKTDIKKVGNNYYQLVEHSDGRKEFVTVQDKIKALAELNKMDGSYAIEKHEVAVKSVVFKREK